MIVSLRHRRYSSVPTDTKVPKMGDPIRRSPCGVRRQDDALIRVVNVTPGELFVLHSQMYRTIKADEFAGYLWAAEFALSPHEACGLTIPPMLVLTSDEDGSGGEMNAVALVRNLHSHGVRVN